MDLALGRTINADKLLLNTLRAYRATTIVYDESVPRGSKMEPRGERGQLVGYEDSMYRVWIPSKHKVKRTPHCQFIESGELAERLDDTPTLGGFSDDEVEGAQWVWHVITRFVRSLSPTWG